MAASPPAHRPRSPAYWGAVGTLHGAVLLFGVAGLFGKWIMAPALVIVFGRVLTAAAGLGLWLRLSPPSGATPSGAQRRLLWLGGGILALHWAAFFQSIQISSVAVGLLSYSTAPAFAAVLEPLWFRERFSPAALVCAGLSIAGVALMVPHWDPAAAPTQGVGWGLLAGVSFAVLSILNRSLVRRHAPMRIAFHQDLAATVLLLPAVAWMAPSLSGQDLALLAVLGLACTALAHTLFIRALGTLTARSAALAGTLEPVYGILLAWLLLDEIPAGRTLAGGALVLAAVAWATARPEPPR